MCSSDDIVLSVRNVSKCFEMYEKPVHRLYQTLCAGRKKFYREFWALKDISFDVRKGQCVGIIGRNGAGKSTLLQIVTGTLAPASGEVKVNGRIAALLELGSGFNPEFTGRENVYLNASILGLSRKEIDERYDDIVAFADIGDFIDQPVKTYSSGMMVRLAFAVNVFVDPEILIVDEALAVGDAEFQLKCAKRMRKLLNEGVTVLFVSHDISAVRTYCDRAIWLADGAQKMMGDVKETTSRYLEELFGENGMGKRQEHDVVSVADVSNKKGVALKRWGTGVATIESFLFSGSGRIVEYGERLVLELKVVVHRQFSSMTGLTVAFSIRTKKAVDVACCSSADDKLALSGDLKPGDCRTFRFEWTNELHADEYCLVMAVENRGDPSNLYADYIENGMFFRTAEPFPIYSLTRPACKITMKEA